MNGREARLATLVALLSERGPLGVDEIVVLLAVSPATVRRDLSELTRRRQIVRSRGAARVFRADEESPIPVRDRIARDAKRRVAEAAVALIPPGRMAVAIGGGTTTSAVVDALDGRTDVTVVTNSLTIALQASARRVGNVVVIGGFVRRESQEFVGAIAEQTLSAMTVAFAFLGAGGVSADAGATTHNEAEARTNHAVVTAAQRTVIVADGTKVGNALFAQLAPLAAIDTLVTDASADPLELAALRAHGVRVVLADH